MAQTPTIYRLTTDYWRVTWTPHLWIQWPVGRYPKPEDCFGWITDQHIEAAVAMSSRRENGAK